MTTESDRELLELAAKAAGFQRFEWVLDHQHNMRLHCWNGELCTEWNPLNDDGDAFRLAISCMLTVLPGVVRDSEGNLYLSGIIGNDFRAATRDAIVNAAAEIGRNMK